MKPYGQFKPSQYDCKGLVSEDTADKLDWLVSVGTNRDADSLIRSNWIVAQKMLEKADPEGNDHEAWSFGHWACGWFEILVVRPGTAACKVAEEIEETLEDCAFLDENHHSELELDEMEDYWKHMSLRERLAIIKKANWASYRISIFAARRDEVPEGCEDYLMGN